VLYCNTAFKNACCSSRVNTVFMTAPGIGCVQHLGGILDSSTVDCEIMTAKQCWQYGWPHGSVCKASLSLVKSSRQHIQELGDAVSTTTQATLVETAETYTIANEGKDCFLFRNLLVMVRFRSLTTSFLLSALSIPFLGRSDRAVCWPRNLG